MNIARLATPDFYINTPGREFSDANRHLNFGYDLNEYILLLGQDVPLHTLVARLNSLVALASLLTDTEELSNKFREQVIHSCGIALLYVVDSKNHLDG